MLVKSAINANGGTNFVFGENNTWSDPKVDIIIAVKNSTQLYQIYFVPEMREICIQVRYRLCLYSF